MLVALSPPKSTVFDLVLLLHVGVVVISAVAVISTYVAAATLGKARVGESWPPPAVRYFSPGPNIAGRVLYLIPITGFVLVSISHGHYVLSTPFVSIGIGIWIAAIVVAELLVFPAEARIVAAISSSGTVLDPAQWRSSVAVLRWSVDAVVLLLVLGVVVMVAQP